MIFNHYSSYKFKCYVIGTIAEIKIFYNRKEDLALGIRNDGSEFDIENINNFLIMASNRGCDIKPY